MFKKITLIVVLILLAAVVFFNRVAVKEYVLNLQKDDLPAAVQYSNVIANEVKQSDSRIENISNKNNEQRNDQIASVASQGAGLPRNDSLLPQEYNLDVPFQSQAPTLNWGMPYQEACEEASLIMADAFFNGRALTVTDMDISIKKLVDWQEKKFGYYEDTTPAEVVTIAKEYFKLNAQLDYDVSVENIKKQIVQNKLVLIPAAGKILPNPNFQNGGPLYHMLIIRGYTPDKFITNDPGTKRGQEFVYKYNDLLNAMHAWPRPTGGSKKDVTEAEMLKGEKVMIVVDIIQ